MASFKFQPEYLTQETCKENATPQMLSFILDPESECKSDPWHDPLLSRDVLQDEAFADGPAILNWTSHNIYDVDGLLVFLDNTLDMGGGKEWRVRTAASDVLQTPVKSIYVGSKLDLEGLAAKALVD